MGSRRVQLHRNDTMNQTQGRSPGDLSLNLFWIGLGLFFLWFSRDIPAANFTSEGDPGPRAFPQWLALTLVLGGTFELGRQRFLQGDAPQESVTNGATRKPFNAIVVLIAVGLYIPALPWIGFSLATLVLVTGLLRFLGSRWWLSLTVAFSLVMLIQLLFGYAFNVPLPTNHWGLVLPGGFLF